MAINNLVGEFSFELVIFIFFSRQLSTFTPLQLYILTSPIANFWAVATHSRLGSRLTVHIAVLAKDSKCARMPNLSEFPSSISENYWRPRGKTILFGRKERSELPKRCADQCFGVDF